MFTIFNSADVDKIKCNLLDAVTVQVKLVNDMSLSLTASQMLQMLNVAAIVTKAVKSLYDDATVQESV